MLYSTGGTGFSSAPANNDLATVAAFSDRLEDPEFLPGEWFNPPPGEDGTLVMGGWPPSAVVAEWHMALYEHNIMDRNSDYLA